MRATRVILLAAACGCSNYDTVESFADCHVGMYFADCGGSREPVFGCNPNTDQCWWFTNGAVPRAVTEVSDCPSDNLCCHDNWPFASDVCVLGPAPFVYTAGDQPWDREREMNLTVAVDLALQVGAATVTCVGSISSVGMTPCNVVAYVVAHDLDTPAIEISGPEGVEGDVLVVEIDRADAGNLRARVCFDPYTDAFTNQCDARPVRCAASGTITLASFPPTTVGAPVRLDVTFPDGSHVTGEGSVGSVAPRPAG